MKDLEIKKNILQEIMDLMDEKEADGLKNHPKFMAAKLEIAKPEESDEEKSEDPSEDFSLKDMKEDMSEGEEPVIESDADSLSEKKDELNPEDLQKLLELYKQMKA